MLENELFCQTSTIRDLCDCHLAVLLHSLRPSYHKVDTGSTDTHIQIPGGNGAELGVISC